MELAIFLAVAVVVTLYTIGVYNGLVTLRDLVVGYAGRKGKGA